MINKILVTICLSLSVSFGYCATEMQNFNQNVFDDVIVGKINKKYKLDNSFKDDALFRVDYIQGDKSENAKILSIHSYLLDSSNGEQNNELHKTSLDGLKDYCDNRSYKMIDLNKDFKDENIKDIKYFTCSEFKTFTKNSRKYTIYIKSFVKNDKLYVVTLSKIGDIEDNEPSDLESFNSQIDSSLSKITVCKNENKSSVKSCLKEMEKVK